MLSTFFGHKPSSLTPSVVLATFKAVESKLIWKGGGQTVKHKGVLVSHFVVGCIALSYADKNHWGGGRGRGRGRMA